MPKATKKPKVPETNVPEMQFTYRLEQQVLTLEQMLRVETKCGHKRFVLLDTSKGQPAGTLVDKLDLLKLVRTIESEKAAAESKRRAEGHRYDSRQDGRVLLR